ncbi:MAG: phenylalanine--tRNA ligase subunit alpha [Vampirovibrionales bacterium]|nr:phenylalanine--tRNA ligase subunit alpha [Vampirovibrionales bacterium]
MPTATHSLLATLQAEAIAALAAVDSLDSAEAFRNQYLGRSGQITLIKRNLKDLPAEERPIVGAQANELSQLLEAQLTEKEQALKSAELNARLANEVIDVTMPGTYWPQGTRHPITRMIDELSAIFAGMGFAVLDDNACPEVETDYYNFDALNFPADHPARDMQDTFYTAVAPNVLLRSQTSNAQIRHMEGRTPPIQVISPGRVYRNEDVSRKKHVLFHQLEGLMVAEGVTVGHLKGTLNAFIEQLFGLDDQGQPMKTRFRTSFFPFTEPSMEVDVLYRRTIKGQVLEDWLEIMGCGMVDPNVLSEVGIDPERYSGFAFGMGVERLAMLKYGIHNIRDFYTSDLRFLRAFNG